jgi:energy-coupling factor transport system ATP-binding protein
VAIASMLALKPNVLILDEPTSNLDPQATLNIFETLDNLRQVQEMTVIIIEHKLEQLVWFNPVIYTLDHGQISKGLLPAPAQAVKVARRENFDFASDVIKVSESKHPVVEIKNATVDIDGHEILKRINLEAFPGQFIALMGPNGSGKSTLLQSIMGFHEIAYGEFNLMDQPVRRMKTSELVVDVGYVFQNPDHQLFMQTVWNEITLTSENLRRLNTTRKKIAKEWLDQIGLGSRFQDHPQRLSFGEKRRLNVVASLLHGPKLLLIDELLIGQDPQHARHWMTFLKNFSESGLTVILSIHQPRLIREFCHRVVFLEEGEILIDDVTPDAFNQLLELGYHAYLPKDKGEASHA